MIKNGSFKKDLGGNVYSRTTIMLTGTIDCLSFNRDINIDRPRMNVILDNTLERLAQYENAVSRYIIESNFNDIVFVENSGYPFPYEKYERVAEERGKRFEFLYRKLSDEDIDIMRKRGKSWGEADLIDFAMDNSRLIAEANVVYKCTGRVFLKNSRMIIKKAHRQSEFLKSVKSDWAQTYFFKVLKSDYYSFLYGLKDEINDYSSISWHASDCIEGIYYKAIINSKMNVKEFSVFPQVEGITAGSGQKYGKPKCYYLIYDLLPTFFKSKWMIK